MSDRFRALVNSGTGQECYCEHSYQTLGQQTKNSSHDGCFDVGGEDKGASNTGCGLVCEQQILRSHKLRYWTGMLL